MTPDDKAAGLIRAMATINLDQDDETIARTGREFIKEARVIRDEQGAITRPAGAAEHHDDYKATMQIALAIEDEATLITKRETNSHLDYIPMLIAGLHFQTRQITRTAAQRLGMDERQFQGIIENLVAAIINDAFEEAWERVKDKIPPQIVLGDGSENLKIVR